MKKPVELAAMLCLLFAGLFRAGISTATAQAPPGEPPILEGYITAINPGAGFDVNGKHIVATPQTVYSKPVILNGKAATITDPNIAKTLAVGVNVQVFGVNDRHTHSIVASQIQLQPVDEHVNGFAVIQRVVSTSPQLVLEADGSYIAITPKTVLHNRPPFTNQTLPAVDMWIAYSGKFSKNGLVIAEHAAYSSFTIKARLKKGLDKSEAKIIPPDYAGNKDGEVTALYLLGKKHTVPIPADLALQHRVQRIGERLIPASQKILPNGDPQKIDFHFYAIDNQDNLASVGSPDGFVLIRKQIVEALQNDDQVAAVLAYGVAEALEWQVQPIAKNGSAGVLIAAGEVPAFGPAVSLGLLSAGFYEGFHGNYPSRWDPQQNTRVGLSLMHDAGYDVRQAPLAWQIVRYGDVKELSKKPPSLQSEYLLNLIGREYAPNTWEGALGKRQTAAE